MKFFLDTANLDQIREANDLGVLDGVTTNPSLMAKEGIRGEENIRNHYVEICRIVGGDALRVRAVRAGLDELLEGRTTPIIEHRLSTISPVDRIATLHEGHIDEIGSPAELAASRHLHRAAGSRIRLARPAGQNCCAVTSPTDPILLF